MNRQLAAELRRLPADRSKEALRKGDQVRSSRRAFDVSACTIFDTLSRRGCFRTVRAQPTWGSRWGATRSRSRWTSGANRVTDDSLDVTGRDPAQATGRLTRADAM